VEKLSSNEAQLEKAQKRYKAARAREQHNLKRQAEFQKRADLASGKVAGGYPNATNAQAFTAAADRCAHRAHKSRSKAQYWHGKVRAAQQKIHSLQIHEDKIAAELAKWKKEHGVVVEGNRVVGGTPGQRWKTALLASVQNCSNGSRRNFYSQSGSWDIDHEIKGGPEYGHRSDCSSTVTGWAKACGLPDPNGEDFHGGYTGTLVGEHNGWRMVTRSRMESNGKPGYVVYGPGVGHHVEAYLGPGDRTAGHGSAPVDFGTVDLFGDGSYRCFILE
jgi:hypothetical protein